MSYNFPNQPDTPDVAPPVVGDSWGGIAPAATGQLSHPPEDAANPNSQNITVVSPPPHPAYLASPGSIRNAENTILASADQSINAYNNLKAVVTQAAYEDIATDGGSMLELHNQQDNLLLNIGDALTMVGNLTGALNFAVQNYTAADQNSYFPQ
jgi:hypothetical protein